MKNSYVVIRLLLLEVLSAIAFASPSTVPAFLWSTHHQKYEFFFLSLFLVKFYYLRNNNASDCELVNE